MKPKNSRYFPNKQSTFVIPPVNKKPNYSGEKKIIRGSLEESNKLMKKVLELSTKTVGALVLGHVSNGVNSLLNNSKENLPYVLEEKSKNLFVGLTEDKTKVHYIRFKVGYKSTSSVLEAEKQNGISNLELSNSQSDALDTESRSYLSKSFGFNQKSIDFLNNKFYGVINDYEKIYNIVKWNQLNNTRQVPYGLVKQEQSCLKIRNSNTYHAIKVKIHLIKILDDDVDMFRLYTKTFNKSANKQAAGSIPYYYQITDKDIENNNFMSSIICYGNTNLTMSSNFKTTAKIAKTFSKILNPGDTLDFKMFHDCGPGIRFDVAQSYILWGTTVGNQPSSYGIAVEVVGTPCEGVRREDNAIFQGTSPGFYNYEYRKVIVVVKHSSIVSSANLSSATGNISQEYSIKLYENDYLDTKPFNVSIEKIGNPENQDKDFFVVSTSSLKPVYSKNIADTTEERERLIEVDDDLEGDIEEDLF